MPTSKASLRTRTGEGTNNLFSILYKSIAGRYRPVMVADGPITARYRFIKNDYWEDSLGFGPQLQETSHDSRRFVVILCIISSLLWIRTLESLFSASCTCLIETTLKMSVLASSVPTHLQQPNISVTMCHTGALTHLPRKKYSRPSLSRSSGDSLKYFEISVSPHTRFAEFWGKHKTNNQIPQMYM